MTVILREHEKKSEFDLILDAYNGSSKDITSEKGVLPRISVSVLDLIDNLSGGIAVHELK